MASNSFERMANFVYDVNWYSLSLEKQKYFILMLLHAQRSLYFHGYGIAVLNLETFCTVSKADLMWILQIASICFKWFENTDVLFCFVFV